MKQSKHVRSVLNIFSYILIFEFIGSIFCTNPGFKGNQNDLIYVLATDPTGNSFANGKRIETSITSLINNAQLSVYMAVYNFDSRPIMDSLIMAKNRGIHIEIAGDYHELQSDGYIALNQNGINVVAGNLNAIQHNKFIIIDDKILITGTGNISHSDFFNNDNHFLIIRDPSVAEIYKKEFRQMYTGFFSSMKSSFRMSHDRPQTKLPVEIFFSPQESNLGARHMIEKINGATDSIYYMIYAFSQDEIATALLKAARRGIKVYGIHDSSFIRGTSQEAPRLYMAGLNNAGESLATGPFVHADGNTNTFFINGIEHGGKMHCKTMIIDPETNHGVAITGSFNWSNNAVENNDENLLSISDQTVVSSIKHQWDQAWKISKPLNYAFSAVSGSTANVQDIYISEINLAGTFNGTSFLQNDDYIEICNRSSAPVDITHWTITWSSNLAGNDIFYTSYTFPDKNDGTPASAAIIPPGEYRTFYGNKSGPVYSAVSYLQNGIKIPDSKKFSLPDNDISIAIYDRNMNQIDVAKIHYNHHEGNFDAALKTSASMNRRLGSNGKPSEDWDTSKVECLWAVCNSPNFFGSPGYINEPAGPVEFKSIEITNENHFHATFSGSVDSCTKFSDYEILSSSGNIPIENIQSQNESNQLTFMAASASDPAQTYIIKSRASDEFTSRSILYNAPDIFLGTDYGLSRSGDNGITFQNLPIDTNVKLKVNRLTYDSTAGNIYVATSNGLYSTLDNGITFQKIPLATTELSNIVHDISFNLNYLVAATADGIYFADKALLNFQKISSLPAFTLFLTDTLLLAGGYNSIFRFISPFTLPPEIILINGIIHSIKIVGASYYVASTSGVYLSNDSLNFISPYTGYFSNKIVNFIESDFANNPLVLSHNQISGLYSTGIYTYDFYLDQRLINVNSILKGGSGFLAASDYGLLTGATIDSLNFVNKYSCGPDQTLPAGSIVFSGYGTALDQRPAEVIINEISLQNADGHDWIELYITNSGTMKNFKLVYHDQIDGEILYEFGDMHVNTGELILIYLESAGAQKDTLSADKALTKSSPYKFYSTHANVYTGDGILILQRNDSVVDALYYYLVGSSSKSDELP